MLLGKYKIVQETKRSLQGLFNRFMCLIAQVTLQLYFCPDLSTLKNVLYKGRSKKETTILICYLLRNSRHGSMRRESSPLRLPQVEIRYLRDPFFLRSASTRLAQDRLKTFTLSSSLFLRASFTRLVLVNSTTEAHHRRSYFLLDHTRFRH